VEKKKIVIPVLVDNSENHLKWADYEETWQKFSSIHKCRADYINIDHDLEPFKGGITEQMMFIADNMNHNYKFQILNNAVHFYRRQDEDHPAFKKRNPSYKRLRLPPEIPYARTMKKQIEEVIEAGAKIPDLEFSFSFLDVPRVFPYPNQKEQVGHPFDNLKVMMKEAMKKQIENNTDPKFKNEKLNFFIMNHFNIVHYGILCVVMLPMNLLHHLEELQCLIFLKIFDFQKLNLLRKIGMINYGKWRVTITGTNIIIK